MKQFKAQDLKFALPKGVAILECDYILVIKNV